jgi:hypothetical protein
MATPGNSHTNLTWMEMPGPVCRIGSGLGALDALSSKADDVEDASCISRLCWRSGGRGAEFVQLLGIAWSFCYCAGRRQGRPIARAWNNSPSLRRCNIASSTVSATTRSSASTSCCRGFFLFARTPAVGHWWITACNRFRGHRLAILYAPYTTYLPATSLVPPAVDP